MRPTAIIAGEIEEWEAHDPAAHSVTLAWDVGLTVVEGKEAIMVWMALYIDDSTTIQISRFGNPVDLAVTGAGRLMAGVMLEQLQKMNPA